MLEFYLSLIPNDNDKVSFKEIYEAYENDVFKVAMSYIHDYHLAEDATQVAFMGIAKNIYKFNGMSSEDIRIYILKVARNAAFYVIKHNPKNTITLEEKLNIAYNNDLTKTIIDHEIIEQMTAFVATMKPIYRDVLSLHFRYGMKAKEIAKQLNIPEKTAFTRLERGKAIVIEKFKELHYD